MDTPAQTKAIPSGSMENTTTTEPPYTRWSENHLSRKLAAIRKMIRPNEEKTCPPSFLALRGKVIDVPCLSWKDMFLCDPLSS